MSHLAPENSQKEESSGSQSSSPLCLVADDNPVGSRILEVILRKLGFNVIIAHNGAEVIQIAFQVRFDIIFLDIKMPVVDGKIAAQTLRTLPNVNKVTPIIAVTAYENDLSKFTHFSDLISKPVTQSLIESKLKRWLQKSHPAASSSHPSTNSIN